MRAVNPFTLFSGYRFQNKTRLWLWTCLLIALSSTLQTVRSFWQVLMKKSLKNNPERPRVLIVKLDHLGDFILTLPALEAIRRHYPQGRLTLITGHHAEPWASWIFFFDEILYWKDPFFDRNQDQGTRVPGGRMLALLRLTCRLAWRPFDVAVDLSSGSHWITLLLTYLSRAPLRIGDARRGEGFLLTQATDFDDSTPVLDRQRRKMAAMGIAALSTDFPRVHLAKCDCLSARDDLRHHGWDERRPLMGVHARAGCPSKYWNPEKVGRLSDHLTLKYKAQVLWTGTPGDVSFYQQAKRSMRTQPLNFVGRTNVRDLAELIANCSLFISVDSGPMHLAAALGIPLVGLFSGTNRMNVWKPLGQRQVLLQKEVPCAPCGLSECNRPRHDCMEAISIEDVLKAAKSLFRDPVGQRVLCVH